MKKHILIITGYARSGKDTFCNELAKYATVYHTSIVDMVKKYARILGWNGEKDEKGRKFLSDIKIAIDEYNDGSFKEIEKVVNVFKMSNSYDILCIDMREVKDISRAVFEFGAEVVQIERHSVNPILSNVADSQAVSYTGVKTIIPNNGTIEDLSLRVKKFVDLLS